MYIPSEQIFIKYVQTTVQKIAVKIEMLLSEYLIVLSSHLETSGLRYIFYTFERFVLLTVHVEPVYL